MSNSHHLVMFCCNDEHGLPTGRLVEIEIADEIRLVAPSDRGSAFRVDKGRFKVGFHYYPHLGWQGWVGNILWDAGKMHVAEARRLIRHMFARGWVVEEYAESGPFADLARRRR